MRLAPRRGYLLNQELRCLRCALLQRQLLRRSLITALVVGSLITAINQGNVLLGGNFPSELLWKIPMSYAVPFCVATYAALANSRA